MYGKIPAGVQLGGEVVEEAKKRIDRALGNLEQGHVNQ